ncbi:hypothetical protein SLITO_v1c04820 [Spiroplasma litorale]|uniref:Exodeoxyribonuclease VII small subunit n=1 Tax=Spiroplasma litorale TaxID=216942 RepID=A0A0K1W1D6_9MOLU|nr:exodeoxyribonuclease VII small subunit [Spiroplasma litorale]AKX34135.1 hypothetical protein SLITO_v1c04820 [Spiroplasma litorale]
MNNFNELLDEIKNISTKLNDPSTKMEDAIDLFKKGTKLINDAKELLQNLEGEVKKVMEDNKIVDFE